MNRTFSRLSLMALALAAGGVTLVAQQATGGLKGRVTNDKGEVKAGVTVSIVHKNNGFSRSVKSDANGLFSLLSLPVGPYDITYSADGETYKASRNASLGQDVDISFKWPSSAGVTVEVIASAGQASVIDTSSAQVGVTVDSEVLDSLPIVSRDINQAAVLAPGVSIVAGSQVDPTKKSSSYISTGDGAGRGTSFAVDGADNNSTDVGGYVLSVPIDAIGSFQVVTNQYKAEFGRSTAGFFNVLTKSGGNEFGGVLGAQYTTDSLRARRTDETVKSKDALGIYSATVTGPILKDKLFFMVSAERQQGFGAAYDFQPYSIGLYPSLGGIKSEFLKKTVYVKIDWNVSSTVNTSFNYGWSQDSTPHQGFSRVSGFNGNVAPAALGTGANATWAAGGRLTWNIGSNAVFESHLTKFQYKNGIHPDEMGPGNGAPMALLDISTPFGTPGYRSDVQNLGWGGIDPNSLQNTGIERLQWKNELTYIAGSHIIKGGVEYQKTTYADQVLFFGETGLYATRIAGAGVNYANGWDPSIKADENVVRVSFVPSGELAGISYKQYGLYLQDDWNVNPNWSLYGGLRVDWDTQLDYLEERFGGMYKTLATLNPGVAAFSTGKAPEGKKYVEPRLQLLYRPNGDDSLVIKAGAGRFVANVIDNVSGFSRGLSNPINGLPVGARNLATYAFQQIGSTSVDPVASFRAGSIIGNVNGHDIVLPVDLTPYNYANNVGGLRDYFRNTVNSWLTPGTVDTNGKPLLASDFQYPTTDSFNVGFSYRFNDHHAMDATFVYSKSKHLTVNGTLDGSAPELEEYNTQGDQIQDSIFYSNQTASSKQLQFKYAYTRPSTNFSATLVVKDQKSSEGGAAGSFDATSGGSGGLYGEGARYAYRTNPERRSPGTEKYSGTFQLAHRFKFGTAISTLASWHSGKAYDVNQLYNNEFGPLESTDAAHPIEVLGYQEGKWAMDLSLKISHRFNLSRKMAIEPYLTVQNLLNNYDYGANYDGTKFNNDGEFNGGDGTTTSGFGKRGPSYSSSQPRNAVVGVRFTF